MEKEMLAAYLPHKGISRRAFLKYCTLMASVLALPAAEIPRLVETCYLKSNP